MDQVEVEYTCVVEKDWNKTVHGVRAGDDAGGISDLVASG
jgi:hypothetical protein